VDCGSNATAAVGADENIGLGCAGLRGVSASTSPSGPLLASLVSSLSGLFDPYKVGIPH
jgi:hypothetical protein